MRGKNRFTCAIIFTSLVLSSCFSEEESLSNEFLFSLEKGFLADQMSFFDEGLSQEYQMGNLALSGSANIYLSDPIGQKIMLLSNLGDLLSLLYNPEKSLWQDSQKGFVVWPFKSIQNIFYVKEKLYVVDNDLQKKSSPIYVFSNTSNYLYTLEEPGKDHFGFLATYASVDNAQELALVWRGEDSWLIDYYSQEGRWLGDLSYPYEKLVSDGIEAYVSFWPAAKKKFIFYHKRKYIKKKSSFSGAAETWEIAENAIYLKNQETTAEKKIVDLLEDYQDASILGLLEGDYVVIIYYQDGNMAMVAYDSQGKRSKTLALSAATDSPYRLHLAAQGVLLRAIYSRENIEISWWNLNEVWGLNDVP